ncbi:MAG: SUMF1/EgtB/PvdO family nonheme iron enzyme [bacterium]
MNYLDFELEIGLGAGREYPIVVVHSPAGEARATMHFPFDELALENRLKDLQIALLRSGSKQRKTPLPEEQAVQDFGRALFEALVAGEVRSRYDMSQHEAAQKDMGLRPKLRIQSPELAALPWEFLYDSRQAEYVCLSRNTPVVRYLDLPQPIQPLAVASPLRVLGMAVSPHDPKLAALDLQNEKQRVEEAIKTLRHSGQIELTWLTAQTWRDLQKAMRGGPWHVFHFIGHGGFDHHTDEGLIFLADDAGASQRLTATSLGRLLADHRSLRLVILNSCEGARGSEHDLFSSTASILVRRGLPAVLAMQYEITDRAAIEFSRAFYEAMAEAMPVDAVVSEARKAVSFAVNNTVEWGTPVLYMRAPDGKIFDIAVLATERERDNETLLPKVAPVVESHLEKLQTLAKADLARRQEEEQWAALYAEGRAHYEAKQWPQALACFRQMQKMRPHYKRVNDLVAAIERSIEEQNRREQVTALLQEAEATAAKEDWSSAIAKLQQILELEPAHAEAQSILNSARQEQELAELYAQGREYSHAKRWTQALECFRHVQSMRAHYKEVDTLLSAAERERQKEQEARKSKPPQPTGDERKAPVAETTTPLLAPPTSQSRAVRRILVPVAVVTALVLLIYVLSQKKDTPKITEKEIAPEMVLIHGSSFMMGSNDGEDDEKQVHQVYVDDFYLDKYEVTVAQYAQFLQANPSQTKPDNWNEQLQHSNRPVVYVSWEEATAFCEWLSKQRGKRVRLPTEAEWEYAARGGLQGKKYLWGDEISAAKANYDVDGSRQAGWGNAKRYLKDVDSFSPNGFGLYNMAGNVWEWCADRYGSDYYKASPSRNPKGPDSGTVRVLRGGSWCATCDAPIATGTFRRFGTSMLDFVAPRTFVKL